jgi:transglutaminase-like putative cysteine protease
MEGYAMIKNLHLTLLLCFISIIVSSQTYPYFDIHYTGTQQLGPIEFQDTWIITKSSGTWSPDILFTFKVPSYYNRSILHNVLQYWSSEISTSSVKIIISNEHIENDIYGNVISVFNISFEPGYTQNSFSIFLNYSLSTEIDLNTFNPNDGYPLTNVPGNISAIYLAETDNIDWRNTSIRNKAIEIIDGSTTELEVVQKIAEWTKSNIPYIADISAKASDVLRNGGDCDGQANLVIAFLRSLTIPARIASGFSFNIERSYPLWAPNPPRKYDQGKTGIGNAAGHACYEVYYPSQNPS